MKENIKTKKFIDRIDWMLVLLYIALAVIGILSIYSVEHRDTDISFFFKE